MAYTLYNLDGIHSIFGWDDGVLMTKLIWNQIKTTRTMTSKKSLEFSVNLQVVKAFGQHTHEIPISQWSKYGIHCTQDLQNMVNFGGNVTGIIPQSNTSQNTQNRNIVNNANNNNNSNNQDLPPLSPEIDTSHDNDNNNNHNNNNNNNLSSSSLRKKSNKNKSNGKEENDADDNKENMHLIKLRSNYDNKLKELKEFMISEIDHIKKSVKTIKQHNHSNNNNNEIKNNKNENNEDNEELKDSLYVKYWLQHIGMKQYINNYISNGFDSLDILIKMTDKELNEINIKLKGHKFHILNEILKLKTDPNYHQSITKGAKRYYHNKSSHKTIEALQKLVTEGFKPRFDKVKMMSFDSSSTNKKLKKTSSNDLTFCNNHPRSVGAWNLLQKIRQNRKSFKEWKIEGQPKYTHYFQSIIDFLNLNGEYNPKPSVLLKTKNGCHDDEKTEENCNNDSKQKRKRSGRKRKRSSSNNDSMEHTKKKQSKELSSIYHIQPQSLVFRVSDIEKHSRIKALDGQNGLRAKTDIPKYRVLGQYLGVEYLEREYEDIFSGTEEGSKHELYSFAEKVETWTPTDDDNGFDNVTLRKKRRRLNDGSTAAPNHNNNNNNNMDKRNKRKKKKKLDSDDDDLSDTVDMEQDDGDTNDDTDLESDGNGGRLKHHVDTIVIDALGMKESIKCKLIYMNDCRENIKKNKEPTTNDYKYWNVEFVSVYVNGWPQVFAISRTAIKKNDELAVYYGPSFAQILRVKKRYEDDRRRNEEKVTKLLSECD